MNMFDCFRRGAMGLATQAMQYSSVHAQYGLSQDDWELLTSPVPWNVEERRRVRSVLAEAVQISLTIAGLPAQSLPAQYVAAVISIVVAPTNRLVAATRAPESFDAMGAANVEQPFKVTPVSIEQMQSLVMLYSGGWSSEPTAAHTGQVKPEKEKV